MTRSQRLSVNGSIGNSRFGNHCYAIPSAAGDLLLPQTLKSKSFGSAATTPAQGLKPGFYWLRAARLKPSPFKTGETDMGQTSDSGH